MDWFSRMLRLNTPMVVYLGNKSHVEWVKQHRLGKLTLIIYQPLENMPYYRAKDLVAAVLSNESFRSTVEDNNRVRANASSL